MSRWPAAARNRADLTAERFVALEFGNEAVVEAGITPVRVIDPHPSLYTPEQISVLEEATVVQETSLELDIEAIASADPDLTVVGVGALAVAFAGLRTAPVLREPDVSPGEPAPGDS